MVLLTHSESITPLPAAVVHGVPPVQSYPKPVLLVLFGLPVGHIIIISISTIIIIITTASDQLVSCPDPPEGFVEDLEHKVLLLGAPDAQQVGSVPLTEEVRLQPAELLLQLRGMKDLHSQEKDGKKEKEGSPVW